MKPNIKTNLVIKFLAFNIILFSTFNLTIAQKRPQQNIKRIAVTNSYVFENGLKTDKYWAIYQEMYDTLGRMHTEINLDFPDHYPHSYIWHTFNGKQKVKSEIFRNDKLFSIEEFTYNNANQLTKKVIKTIKPADTLVFLTLNYKYDSKGNSVGVSAKTADGEMAYVSKSTYNEKGKELTRKVNVKKNIFPQDSILKLSCKPTYDSVGRLVTETMILSIAGKSTIQKSLKYTYDNCNNQIGLTEFDNKGKQVHREERGFQPKRNRISWVKYFDANDVLVKWTGTRYEIYRTTDQRFREIEY